MSKKPKRRKKNHGAMGIGLLVVLFLMIMLVQIGRLNQKAANLEEEKAYCEQRYQQETERAQNLEEYAARVNSLKYIEEMAKSKLGLVYDNEIIFKEQEK